MTNSPISSIPKRRMALWIELINRWTDKCYTLKPFLSWSPVSSFPIITCTKFVRSNRVTHNHLQSYSPPLPTGSHTHYILCHMCSLHLRACALLAHSWVQFIRLVVATANAKPLPEPQRSSYSRPLTHAHRYPLPLQTHSFSHTIQRHARTGTQMCSRVVQIYLRRLNKPASSSPLWPTVVAFAFACWR